MFSANVRACLEASHNHTLDSETRSVASEYTDAPSQCECRICCRSTCTENVKDSQASFYHSAISESSSPLRDLSRATSRSDAAGLRLSPTHAPRSTYGEEVHGTALPSLTQLGHSEDHVPLVPATESGLRAQTLPQANQASQFTGWAAVEKALTDFDKQEVGAYKEDIDSLLVFAGLYSAVLTAFVIVSYPQLQEDVAAETLQALRLIASQTASYVVLGSQFVNATTQIVDPTGVAQFQPSSAAVRTNALWFSSLVISLATASFSILVKQWLRAYLAFATASPQGQLRVRQFRRMGLESWKVFAIASALPLLLQLALALFFVGLCFFTADIHPVIGNTTLPLVCAWASFFVTVTLAPMFSSSCPYKTPALSNILTALRLHVRSWLPSTRHYPLICYMIGFKVQVFFLRTTHNALRVCTWPIRKLLKVLFRLRHIPSIPGWPYCIVVFMWRCYTKWQERKWASPVPSSPQDIEESNVIKDTSRDLQILVSADALQADDRLLQTTMVTALEQSNPVWTDTISFLVQIIGNRVPLKGSNDPLRTSFDAHVIDLRSLSDGAREAVVSAYNSLIVDKLPAKALNPSDVFSKSPEFHAATWVVYLFSSVCAPGSRTPFRPDTARDFLRVVIRYHRATYSSRSPQHTHGDSRWSLKLLVACMMIIACNQDGLSWWRDVPLLTDGVHFPEPRDGEFTGRESLAPFAAGQATTIIEVAGKNLLDGLVLAIAFCNTVEAIARCQTGHWHVLLKASTEKLLSRRDDSETKKLLIGLIDRFPINPQAYDSMLYTNVRDNAYLATIVTQIANDRLKATTPIDPESAGTVSLKLIYATLRLLLQEKRNSSESNPNTPWPPDDTELHTWRTTFDTLAELLAYGGSQSSTGDFPEHCWRAIGEIGGAEYLDDTTAPVTNRFCIAFGEATSWASHRLCRRALHLRHGVPQGTIRERIEAGVFRERRRTSIRVEEDVLNEAILHTIRRPGVMYEEDRFTTNFCDAEGETYSTRQEATMESSDQVAIGDASNAAESDITNSLGIFTPHDGTSSEGSVHVYGVKDVHYNW